MSRLRRSPRYSSPRLIAWTILTIAAVSPAFAQPVVVKDQRDQLLEFPKAPERIVAIPIPAASTVITVDGGTDRLVGMNPSAKAAIEEGPLKAMFPKAAAIRSDITAQGFMPNVETLLSLRPDVVVQWANQGPELIPAVEKLGLKVLGIRYGTEELARGGLAMYGALLGKPERAAALIAYRDEMRARIDKALAGLSENDKPRVLHLQQGLSAFQAAGAGTYQAGNILLAGGRNVASDLKDFVTVNPEQIVAWAPDIILLNSFESKLFPKSIYDNPLFAGVPAVKNRRVYKLPLGGYRWDPPSQESPLTWLWQATLYHPDRMKDDLRAEMTRAYKLFYGYTLSDAQIDGVLFLAQHENAAGYERFRTR